jgi:hypothetical protein
MGSDRYEPMVRWFSPRELIRTGAELVVSTWVTRLLDPRILNRSRQPAQGESSGREEISRCEHWRCEEETWIDYIADTGDGWNPTYTVARTLAASRLNLVDSAQREHETLRGQILVLGGDLVYPTPRNDSYERRLLAPFREALEKTPQPSPTLLAIPGNHDWYDGLAAFTRRFCFPGTQFAGWVTAQSRSYFAVQLPADWWLLGVDTQLGSRIDKPQLEYFAQLKHEMSESSRVILCTAEPDWLDHGTGGDSPELQASRQIGEVLGRPIEVCLAGDLHHYQRHRTIPTRDDERPRELLTAGGGGAFLHATHAPLHWRLRDRLVRTTSFPPASESKRYVKRVLAFPLTNWRFGLIPAALYTFVIGDAFSLDPPVTATRFFQHLTGLSGGELTTQTIEQLPSISFLLALAIGTFLFRERGSKVSGILALGHLTLHLGAIFFVGLYATAIADKWFPVLDWARFATAISLAAAGGWLLGSFVVGVYLFVSARCNELLDYAYASLRIQDWKSFVRLRIAKDGTLTIYPIGFQRIARSWARRTGEEGRSQLEPDDPRATPPELIEVPIVIGPR